MQDVQGHRGLCMYMCADTCLHIYSQVCTHTWVYKLVSLCPYPWERVLTYEHLPCTHVCAQWSVGACGCVNSCEHMYLCP